MGADRGTLLGQTADIVASYVAKASVPVGEITSAWKRSYLGYIG